MDGRLTRTNCYEAGDYVVPNVLRPRDLVHRPDNMDETVLSSTHSNRHNNISSKRSNQVIVLVLNPMTGLSP